MQKAAVLSKKINSYMNANMQSVNRHLFANVFAFYVFIK